MKRKAKEELAVVEEPEIVLCNSPAPLIINGGMYCGCQRPTEHEGPHEVRISWS